jgi:hypothetical protein
VLEQFEQAWRSHRHEKKDTLHTEIQTLLTALDRERKRSRVILTICSVYTLVSLIGTAIVFSGSRDVPLSEVWPLVVGQALAFAVLAYLVRARFLRNQPNPTSVRDTAESALAETRSGIANLKLVAIAMGCILALLGIAVSVLLCSRVPGSGSV